LKVSRFASRPEVTLTKWTGYTEVVLTAVIVDDPKLNRLSALNSQYSTKKLYVFRSNRLQYVNCAHNFGYENQLF